LGRLGFGGLVFEVVVEVVEVVFVDSDLEGFYSWDEVGVPVALCSPHVKAAVFVDSAFWQILFDGCDD
jgi:hypothetical protein